MRLHRQPINHTPLASQAAGEAARQQASKPRAAAVASAAHAGSDPAEVEASAAGLEKALAAVVDTNGVKATDDPNHADAHSYHSPATSSAPSKSKHAWLRRFFNEQTMDRLFVQEQLGQYVIVRATGEQIFEEMPLYVRIGMHLLFVSGVRLLAHESVDTLLVRESERQGRVYDQEGPEVLAHIQSFVDQFSLPLDELVEPDLTKYKTFNAFFSRRIRPEARPPAEPADPTVIASLADCRLTVFDSVDDAKRIWIKGQQFSVPALLGLPTAETDRLLGPSPSVAVFRLAPQDYHRFHAGLPGVLGPARKTGSTLYTVNPQAVNEDLDVFTANRREIRQLTVDSPSDEGGRTSFVVAVGAMLVGSILWEDDGGQTDDPAVAAAGWRLEKGEPCGAFAYGGSTVILVTPTGSTEWDADLASSSRDGVEQLVKAGERIGRLR